MERVNPLSTNFTKWSNTLKQFVGKLPTNCLRVIDHFVGLVFKRLRIYGGVIFYILQKQPPRGIPRKRCSENMQQSDRRTPMPKCDFNKFALQLYWNHTSAWAFSCEFSCEFDCFWLSLFHFFKNSQHPEKWSVSFQNFFRKCEYISCYLPISLNLLKISFRKSSRFVFTVIGVIETSVLLAAYFKLLL